MNFPEVRAMGGVGMGGAGLPPTHTPTTPTPTPTPTDSALPTVPPPVASPPEATPYLGFQSTPGLSSPPAVSHPSIASMWGIGGFTTPPMPTPPPVVCPNTIASTLGIPQMPNVTYFNSRAPMGFNFRMAGSLNGVPYVFKRKPEEEPDEIKQVAKQHISEERMTAHLNSLHLSDSYCNHRLGKGKGHRKLSAAQAGATKGAGGGADVDEDEGLGGDDVMSLDGSSPTQGPRLVIADEVKQIVPGEAQLPESILKKLTQPSMEVVLWQPPTNILRTVIPPSIDSQIKASQNTTTTSTTSSSSTSGTTVSSNIVSTTTSSSSSPSSSSSSPDSGISITSPPPPPDSFIGRSASITSPSITTALNEAVAAAAARAGGSNGGNGSASRGFPGPSSDPGVAPLTGGTGGISGSCSFPAPSSELGLDLLSLPSTSSGSRGSGFLPLPLRRPASPLPDPMADDDFSERMEFNNNNGNAPNFMWLEENNNTALMDLNAVEPQRAAAAAAPAQPPPQAPLPEDLPDFPDSDDMDL